nr:MAG TPA: hypothetical protein [Caudoviricetes sp.]
MVSERLVLNVRDEDRTELEASDNIFADADYNKLKNLPKLDGRPIIGDIPELDPTVPDWAKTPTKPEYKAEEVGAIPEGAMLELDAGDFAEMWEATI